MEDSNLRQDRRRRYQTEDISWDEKYKIIELGEGSTRNIANSAKLASMKMLIAKTSSTIQLCSIILSSIDTSRPKRGHFSRTWSMCLAFFLFVYTFTYPWLVCLALCVPTLSRPSPYTENHWQHHKPNTSNYAIVNQ